MAASVPKSQPNIGGFATDAQGVASDELLVPLYVPDTNVVPQNIMEEPCFGPSDDNVDEDPFPPPRLVRLSCKMMFGVLLDDLGLPSARYSSYVHEDGEVSAVVTFYSPFTSSWKKTRPV